tara:strand:+ start:91 stop:432 length:342 start_codon:yes stop_codon:yes gene_type:complete
MKIYHNPRCKKSRETLLLMQQKRINIEIIRYLDSKLTVLEIKQILKKLNFRAIELIRKNEKIWKEQNNKEKLKEIDLINLMINYPKIIERPIVISGNKAIIGRPPENVLKIIN